MEAIYHGVLHALGQQQPPAVKAIHIARNNLDANPSAKFGAVELTDGTIGLTYTKLGDALDQLQDASRYQHYCQQPITELAKLYLSNEPWQQVLGSGALNALSQWLLQQQEFQYPDAVDTLELLKIEAGDRVGMVGYFPPLVKTLTEQGTPVTVIELKPELAREDGPLKVTMDPSELQHCQKILITGTTVINHTLSSLLPHCRQAAQVALIGPSVGLLPQVLFDLGLTAIGGRVILDGPRFLERWQQGEKWKGAAQRYSLAQR
ncbi:Uncharacterized conserved protein, contains DUF4213 and DUF364 domains [Ferrimonas sediminum]|uniref:Uncharacterized conserved protein, contains DUF4213 and DUF364 domains n=1 Tax=Ferrimonas sediminum TaxID=718193 RepID=A0A1G8WXN9_9GAMM|nr:DUF364 domain-containing protein [Ferrimonas sediminum]SDJ83152.1 Uncharacterized conserved protein, contains DUF4213 and DUF364 domains [Ferrimonas sediminum]